MPDDLVDITRVFQPADLKYMFTSNTTHLYFSDSVSEISVTEWASLA